MNKQTTRPETKKKIILAGNFKEFLRYRNGAALGGEDPKDLIYGDSPRNMAGVEAGEVVVIGTFWQRRDARGLYTFANTRVKG